MNRLLYRWRFIPATAAILLMFSMQSGMADCQRVVWANGGSWGGGNWVLQDFRTFGDDGVLWANYWCIGPWSGCDKYDWKAESGCSVGANPALKSPPPTWANPALGAGLIRQAATAQNITLPSNLPGSPTVLYYAD